MDVREFLDWLFRLPFWAYGLGMLVWLGIAFLVANLMGKMTRLGGPNDIRERRRARNRRTVKAQKRERKLVADQFKNILDVPTWVCYSCLWQGNRARFRTWEELKPYCPECGWALEAYDAKTDAKPNPG